MPASRKSWLLDAAVLSVAFLFTALYCFFISRHRILWSDELFGWMLVTDPTWHHMLFAWREGADGGGIVFYTLTRVWFDATERTVLAFRAFSAACCFVGLAGMWFTLRRFYGAAIVSITLFIVWFGSRTILWQMIQNRFYGLMLGASALALYAAVSSASDAEDRGSQRPSTLAITFAASLVLVGSQPLGIVYSASILAGAFLFDRIAYRSRPAFYIAAILPWTLLLFSRQAMENSAKVGKPYFWTTRPTFANLTDLYGPSGLPVLLYPAILVIAFLLYSAYRRNRIRAVLHERGALLLPGLILSLLPLPMWLVSQQGTSYFVDRYLLPFTLGVAVLAAETLTQLHRRQFNTHNKMAKAAFAVLIAVLVSQAVVEAVLNLPEEIPVPPHDFTPALADQLPRGLPVVFERPDIFNVMLAQQRSPDRRFYYLLDWETAIAPESPHGIVSGHHEMENWKHVGYFSGSILESSDFLKTTSRFVVVDDPDLKWFERRILNHPEWRVTPLSQFHNRLSPAQIWLVERR